MIAWLAYAVAVSALLGLAARAAEAALRPLGLPTRWPWAVALAGSCALPLAARFDPWAALTGLFPSGGEEGGVGLMEAVRVPAAAGAGGPDAAASGWWSWLWALPDRLSWPDSLALPDGAEALLLGGWGLASLALVLFLAAGWMRIRRWRRGWGRTRVEGLSVRVSRRTGPAVAGLLDPVIVVPRWLVARGGRRLRMAVTHEAEHIRARDPALLAAALVMAAALPWNLPMWWQLRRLRLAVEVDCDRRTLGRGAPLSEYGDLLLAVGTRRAGLLPLLSPSLGESWTQLERRIRAMTDTTPRFPGLKAAGLALAAVAAVALACDTPVPQAPDADGPTAPARTSSADESRAEVLGDTLDAPMEGLRIVLDDATVVGADASVGEIVSLSGSARLRAGKLELRAMEEEARVRAVQEVRKGAILEEDGTVRTGTRIRVKGASKVSLQESPLIFIDGVRVGGGDGEAPGLERKRLDELHPEEIKSVEVIKGQAAEVGYGSEGANGVILIHTRSGSG